MYTIRKILKYLSYSFVYLIISLASAYGVILLASNNTKTEDMSAETQLPQQISSMVEHFSSAQALDLNLTADICSNADKYTINLDAMVDMSKGIENIEAQGTLTAVIHPTTTGGNTTMTAAQAQTVNIDFNYQEDYVYLDMLGGKMVVQTSSFMQTVTELLSIMEIDLASTGITEILNMPIKDMLMMLSNIKEEQTNPDQSITMIIALPMVGDATLTCAPGYKLEGLASDMVISDDMTVGVNSSIAYPEDIVIEDKNQEDYVNIGNLLQIAKPLTEYLKQDKFALSFNAKQQLESLEYQTLAEGNLYLDTSNKQAKLSLKAFGDFAHLHFIDNVLYLEYKNIYTKYNLLEIEKLTNTLEDAFGIEVPKEVIDTVLALLNGEQLSLPTGELLPSEFNLSEIDLSIIEKVEVKDNSTIVKIRDIGTIRLTAKEDLLTALAYSGFGYQASMQVVDWKDFSLTTDEENYIDLALLLPTIENAASIFSGETISGSFKTALGGQEIKIDFSCNMQNNTACVYTSVLGLDVNIYFTNEKVYVNIENKFNFVCNIATFADDIQSFLGKIGISLPEVDKTQIMEIVAGLIDPSVTPFFITNLQQTPYGFVVTLLDEISISITNTAQEIAISTSVENMPVHAVIKQGGRVDIPSISDEDYNNISTLLDIVALAYNKGITKIITPTINTFKSGKIGLETSVDLAGLTIPAQIMFCFADKTMSITSSFNDTALNLFYEGGKFYFEYGNLYFDFALNEFEKLEAFLANNFALTLPSEMIGTLVTLLTEEEMSIKDMIDYLDKPFDLASIDLALFDYFTINDDHILINLGEKSIKVNYTEEEFTNIEFSDICATFVDYISYSKTTADENYINLTTFLPTVESALKIIKEDVVSGSLKTAIDAQEFKLNFAFSRNTKEGFAYANILGIDLNIYFENEHVFINIEDKFKFFGSMETISDIKDFLGQINVDLSPLESFDAISTIKDILNPAINPLIITDLTQTKNGFVMTILDEIVISVINGSSEVAINSVVASFPLTAILKAGGEVALPSLNIQDYTDFSILLDIAAAAYNKGLTNLITPALNSFSSGNIGIDLTLAYEGYSLPANAFISLPSKSFAFTSSVNNTPLQLIFQNGVVYCEYGNLYLSVALSDYDDIDSFLNSYLSISLPSDFIKKAISLITADSISPDQALNTFDFTLNLADFDLALFDNISVNSNSVVASLGDDTFTLNYTDDAITGFAFNDLASGSFIDFQNKALSTDTQNYVNITSFLPTIQNALSICDSDVISGSVALTINNEIYNLSFAYSHSLQQGLAYTQIFGIDVNIYLNQNNVFVNVENKFKFVSDTTTFIDDISSFLASVGFNSDIDTDAILDKAASILNPSVNSLLIKNFSQVDDDLVITLFNDMVISIVNADGLLAVNSALENIPFTILLQAGGEVALPSLNIQDYTDFNILLDIAAAAYNKGLTNLITPALNSFSSGNIGIDLTLAYEGYSLPANAFISLPSKSFAFTSSVNNTPLNLIFQNGVVYCEYGNLYLSVALSDYDDIDSFLNSYLGISLPSDFIKKAISLITADSISPDQALNTFDFTLNLADFDLALFDNISVNSNSVVASLGDDTFTLNYTDDAISGFAFNDLAAGSFIDFQNKALSTDTQNYVNITSFLPTIQNALSICDSDVIGGEATITLNQMTLNPIFVYTQSTNEAIVNVTIEGIALRIYYKDGDIYINFGDKFKFVSSEETIMQDVMKMLADFGINTEVDTDAILEEVANVLNPIVNTLLIKNFIDNDGDLTITLFNDIIATITNNTQEIVIKTGFDAIALDLTIDTVYRDAISAPIISEGAYLNLSDLGSITEGMANSGMLDMAGPLLGTLDFAASGNVEEGTETNYAIGLDITFKYEDNTLPANLYLSVNDRKLSFVSEINSTPFKLIYNNANFFVEYGNIYFTVALADYDEIDMFLNKNFGLTLPSDMIKTIISLITDDNLTTEEAFNAFDFDISSLDATFFENVVVADGKATINLDGQEISIIYSEEMITSIDFGYGSAVITNYVDHNCSTDANNYINLTSFFQTIENALAIIENDVVSGKLNTSVEGTDIELNFAYSQSTCQLSAYTQVFGMNINIYLSDNKAYVNVHDKFKFISNMETVEEDLKAFLAKVGVSTEVDTDAILAEVATLLNVTNNPLLIKNFTEEENGLIVTMFNDIVLSLTNGEETLTLATAVENIPVSILVQGGGEVVVPALSDEEFTDINVLLNIAAAAHNAGLTNLIEPAFNTLSTGNLGATFTCSYDEVEVSGHISINVSDLTLGINVNVRGVDVNIIILADDVVYVEFGNVYVKYALSDLPQLGELLEKHFSLDLPFDKILEVLNEIRSGTFNAVEALDKFDFNFDLSTFDLSFFDNITATENTYLIPIDEDIEISLTADDKLKSLGFAGFGLSAEGQINEYKVFDLSLLKEEYIDINKILPTIDNVLDIITYNTLSGQIVIYDQSMDLNIPIDYVISKDSELYVSFSTSIYGAHISGQYYKEKVYLEFAESVKIVVDVLQLPTAIQEVMESAGKNLPQSDAFNSIDSIIGMLLSGETNSILSTAVGVFDNMKSILNRTAIEVLIKNFITTENGLIITLYDDMAITIDNYEAEIDIATAIDNIALDISLIGSDTTVTIPTINDSDYIPVENLLELVKAFFHMTHKDDFNIQGTLHIIGTLIGIDIKMDVDVNAQVKIVDGKVQFQAIIGEIPAIVGVNNDVPYKFGDTESGSDRYVYLYFDGGDLYIYRHEYVDIVFGASKREYEKCTKVSADTLLADPMYYLQYMIGFTDSIMGEMQKAMDLAQNRENPVNLNNVVNDLACSGDTFDLVLNLAELANNDLLDTLDLDLLLNKDSEGKSYIYQLGLAVLMPLAANVFDLDISSDNIRIVDYGQSVDLSRLNNYVTNYKYNYGEEWEASDGEWSKASDKQYTIYFEENGGDAQTDITGVYGSAISLPTYTNSIVTDDGIAKTTATFAGWYTTATFLEGTLFTETTMPRRDTTLYAKWNKDIVYYRTIKFVTNSADVVNPITALEGTVVEIPSLTTKQVTEGDETTTYKFGGWYTDSTCTKEFTSYVIPSTSTVLYAKWDFVKTEVTKTFALVDNGNQYYSYRIKAGDSIDLSGVEKVTLGGNYPTKFYLESSLTNEYTGDFTMPETDLTLYICNAYTLNIISNYGNVVNSSTKVYQGATFSLPSQQAQIVDDVFGSRKITYTFNGYKTNGANVNSYNMPNADITIEADWSVLTQYYYTITFDSIDGVRVNPDSVSFPVSSITKLEGETVDLTQAQYKPTWIYSTGKLWVTWWHYDFEGWEDADGNTVTTYTFGGSNETIYATWGSVVQTGKG